MCQIKRSRPKMNLLVGYDCSLPMINKKSIVVYKALLSGGTRPKVWGILGVSNSLVMVCQFSLLTMWGTLIRSLTLNYMNSSRILAQILQMEALLDNQLLRFSYVSCKLMFYISYSLFKNLKKKKSFTFMTKKQKSNFSPSQVFSAHHNNRWQVV